MPPTIPILQAIDTSQRHDAWIEQYTAQSAELVEWIANTTAYYQDVSFTDSSEKQKALVDEFNAYKGDVKPDWKSKKTALEGLYNTFITSCRNNDRPLYTPADGTKVSDVDAAWTVRALQRNGWQHCSMLLPHTYMLAHSTGFRGD